MASIQPVIAASFAACNRQVAQQILVPSAYAAHFLFWMLVYIFALRVQDRCIWALRLLREADRQTETYRQTANRNRQHGRRLKTYIDDTDKIRQSGETAEPETNGAPKTSCWFMTT